mgnify:FL=1
MSAEKAKPTGGKTAVDALEEALREIRRIATEHFRCDQDCYERRDMNALAEQGGDVCDWTTIAILADDALNESTKLDNRTGKSRFEGKAKPA